MAAPRNGGLSEWQADTAAGYRGVDAYALSRVCSDGTLQTLTSS